MLGVDGNTSYQGSPDWQAAARAGVGFGIWKATEGVGWVSTGYRDAIAGMRAHGIVPGAYHFLRPGDGMWQFRAFAQVVGDPAGMLICLDVEDPALTIGQVQDWLSAKRQMWGAHPVGIYSNRGQWPGGNVAAPDTWAWHSGCADGRYTTATGTLAQQLAATTLRPSPYGGFTRFPILQYTDHARVPGFGGLVDGNVLTGDIHALTGAEMAYTDADAKTWGEHEETFGSRIGKQTYNEMLGGTYAHARDLADALLTPDGQAKPIPVTLDPSQLQALADLVKADLAAAVGPALVQQLLDAMSARLQA